MGWARERRRGRRAGVCDARFPDDLGPKEGWRKPLPPCGVLVNRKGDGARPGISPGTDQPQEKCLGGRKFGVVDSSDRHPIHAILVETSGINFPKVRACPADGLESAGSTAKHSHPAFQNWPAGSKPAKIANCEIYAEIAGGRVSTACVLAQCPN